MVASNANYAAGLRLALVEAGLEPALALALTPHSEKATVISWGIHNREGTRDLLVQGGCKSRDESMPLKYGRCLGAISLDLTRKLFGKLRGSWLASRSACLRPSGLAMIVS